MADDDGVVLGDLVEMLTRQRDIEFGVVEHDGRDPHAGRGLIRLGAQVGQQFADATHVGIDRVKLVDSAHVAMSVGEAGRDGGLSSIDNPRAGRRQITNVGGRAHGEEPAVFHGKGLRARQRRIDGVHPRIDDDQIRLGASSWLDDRGWDHARAEARACR